MPHPSSPVFIAFCSVGHPARHKKSSGCKPKLSDALRSVNWQSSSSPGFHQHSWLPPAPSAGAISRQRPSFGRFCPKSSTRARPAERLSAKSKPGALPTNFRCPIRTPRPIALRANDSMPIPFETFIGMEPIGSNAISAAKIFGVVVGSKSLMGPGSPCPTPRPIRRLLLSPPRKNPGVAFR